MTRKPKRRDPGMEIVITRKICRKKTCSEVYKQILPLLDLYEVVLKLARDEAIIGDLVAPLKAVIDVRRKLKLTDRGETIPKDSRDLV